MSVVLLESYIRTVVTFLKQAVPAHGFETYLLEANSSWVDILAF